jgi:hypothetical protein
MTVVVVLSGWVLFRSQDLHEAGKILRAMLTPFSGHTFNMEYIATNPIAFALCIAGAFYCFAVEPRFKAADLEEIRISSIRAQVGALAMLGAALVLGWSQITIPFLYFQF